MSCLHVTSPTQPHTHSIHDALPISDLGSKNGTIVDGLRVFDVLLGGGETLRVGATMLRVERLARRSPGIRTTAMADRKSTRLNSSHLVISYAVFCLK